MKKIKILIIVIIILLLMPLFINIYIILSTKNKIYNIDDLEKKYDIALILGCSVLKNGEPSKMLKDRLDKGIELYNNGLVDYLLISGDHSDSYSEVDVMYKYLINNNIDEDAIILDNYGYSTSESISNYYDNYKAKSLIIVTQEYHLYRSLYIAKVYNLEVIGVYAKKINYYGELGREVREILARNKDFVKMNCLKLKRTLISSLQYNFLIYVVHQIID